MLGEGGIKENGLRRKEAKKNEWILHRADYSDEAEEYEWKHGEEWMDEAEGEGQDNKSAFWERKTENHPLVKMQKRRRRGRKREGGKRLLPAAFVVSIQHCQMFAQHISCFDGCY